jgi:hypothetical protein
MNIDLDDIIHGTCGNCGGPVVTSRVWMGTQRQTPTCKRCGATAKGNYGQRVEMNPPPCNLVVGGSPYQHEVTAKPASRVETHGDLS